jgi:3-deoxy-D-manno-octulosonate 8-phosphate phosphatase (KDO 8-P phosphatase)
VKTLCERCSAVELLLVDVDGVLTTGGIVYGSVAESLRDSECTRGASALHSDLEIKEFFVRDGSGLHLWHRAGKRTGLLTGRSSPLVEHRASELGIGWVVQGASEKLSAYRRILAEAGVGEEAVCYIGDDVPDVPLLRLCGLAVAVADACPEARTIAHYITQAPGGRGAVRETIELILRCQGRWPEFV